jgi:hypothetical protein
LLLAVDGRQCIGEMKKSLLSLSKERPEKGLD